MGLVYLVYDRDLNRPLALKVIKGSGTDLQRRFLAEGQVMAQLKHPNILPIHDFSLTAQGQPYYTMPYLQGRTLAEILEALARGDSGVGSYSVTRLLQILLGFEAPRYHHHRLLVDDDGQKLAKSKGARSLRALREMGLTRDDVLELISLG